MLICKSCKDKFYTPNENSSLEGKMVKCTKCNAQWIYESKTKYLEDRLSELVIDLDNTENKINLRKKEREDKISLLINDLNFKKEELEKQKNLEEKVSTFENRLKVTEKLNLEELDLDKKAHKIQKEIRTGSKKTSDINQDEQSDEKKDKKFKFFSPGFIK